MLLSRKDYWKAPKENEKKFLGALLDYHLSSFSTTYSKYSKSMIFVKYLVDHLLLLLVIHHSPMQ